MLLPVSFVVAVVSFGGRGVKAVRFSYAVLILVGCTVITPGIYEIETALIGQAADVTGF